MMDETSWEKFRRAVQDEPFDAEAWEEEGRRRRVEVLVAARKEVLMALDAVTLSETLEVGTIKRVEG